jgi:hypothetical protein
VRVLLVAAADGGAARELQADGAQRRRVQRCNSCVRSWLLLATLLLAGATAQHHCHGV